jgi:hypothetical protein
MTGIAARAVGRGRIALSVLALGFVALRGVTAWTDSINWDEFALLTLAAKTAETDTLHSGSRPGLAVIALLPFVSGCEDEIAVVRAARLLWLGFSVALIAGLAALLHTLLRERPARSQSIALGVALLAAVPPFLQWSIQIRTDQIAIATVLWAAVAALRSRQRPSLAGVAGALAALGYLATPKAAYLLALAGLLAAADVARARDLHPRREAMRLCFAALGAAIVVGGFWLGIATAFDAPVAGASAGASLAPNLSHGLDIFAFYRHTIGYSQYRDWLPWLAPHGALGLALVALSISQLRARRSLESPLLVAWATLALGGGVAAFHAAAFSYFWMTLGVFPAVALALAWSSLKAALAEKHPAAPRVVAVGLACALLAPATLHSLRLLDDTQSVQRASLSFVRDNFARDDEGFQPEGALFCRLSQRPFEVYFSQHLWQLFGRDAESRARNSEALLEEFRRRPVRYLVESWRLGQFPPEVQRFWGEHYQPYRGAVWVAGRHLEGSAGETVRFPLILAAEYRWLPVSGPQALRIDDVRVAPGEIPRLSAGEHWARFEADTRGVLLLALPEPPGPAQLAFYKRF